MKQKTGGPGTRLTWEERAAVAAARAHHRKMPVRKLARLIYESSDMPLGEALMYRTFNGIYSALRRHSSNF